MAGSRESSGGSTSRATQWVLAAVLLGWMAWAAIVAQVFRDKSPVSFVSSAEHAGQFGDAFGALNALFTALAFAAVWASSRTQQRELSLQRDALELQRQELQETREELRRTAEAQEKLVAASELASERTLRAYVNVESARVKYEPATDTLVVTVAIKNYGKTPAYRLTPVTAVAVTEAFGNLAPANDQRPPMGVLAPTAAFVMTIGLQIPVQQREAIRQQALHLFVYGVVRYDDAFGQHRTLTYKVRGTGNSMLAETAQRLESADDGNDAD